MEYTELFDKIVKEAETIGRTVADATKETADKAKTRLDIYRAEYDRDKAFASLGRIMYQIEKGSLKRDDSIIAAACKRIEDLEEEISGLKNAGAEKKEEKAAPEAAAEQPEETPAEQPEEPAAQPEQEDKAPEAE